MIAAVAEKNQARLFQAHSTPEGTPPFTISLPGRHQQANAAVALATVAALQNELPVAAEKIRAGLASVYWPGRLQLIQKANGAKILLDGAHNAAGAGMLRLALENEFGGMRPTLIFGSLGDKQWLEICRILAPLAVRILTVPVASKRTAVAEELSVAFRKANPSAEVAVHPNLAAALSACQEDGFVVITGSLYLIGEALDLLGQALAGSSERSLNEWSGGRKSG